jgi:hypothetical protein
MTRCAHCHQIITKRDGQWIHVATGRRFDRRPEQHIAGPGSK